MKNQYFGDINDYRKYGLLRILRGVGRGLAICWMLTPDDGRSDGGRRKYLLEDKAALCEDYDPRLYRALQRIERRRRSITCANDRDILPEAIGLPDPIPEEVKGRRQYFRKFLMLARGTELVFFDPDNGLEVPSAPYRTKRSPKHLYTDELWQTFDAGHSILLYQHFGRYKRDPFVAKTAEELHSATGVRETISCRTAHVVFFLLMQPAHKDMRSRALCVETKWPGEIRFKCHPFHSCE
jgi:hypothetical protein